MSEISQVPLDSASVQRYATNVLAIFAMHRWAKPSQRMIEETKELREGFGIKDPLEWARGMYRPRPRPRMVNGR